MSNAPPQLPGGSMDAPVSLADDGPLRLDVIAVDAADVVRSAGGWLFNRSHHGWAVNVFLAEHSDGRALQILGAKLLPLQSLSEVPIPGARPHLVAAASEVIRSGNGARTGVAKVLAQARGRLVIWGDPLPIGRPLENLQHRLTPAGMAFKAHAMRAVAEDSVPSILEEFRGRSRAMGPYDFDLSAAPRFTRTSPSSSSTGPSVDRAPDTARLVALETASTRARGQ